MRILNNIEALIRAIDPQVANEIAIEREKKRARADLIFLQNNLKRSAESLKSILEKKDVTNPMVFNITLESAIKMLVINFNIHPDYRYVDGVQISEKDVALRDGRIVSLKEAETSGLVVTLKEIEAIMRA